LGVAVAALVGLTGAVFATPTSAQIPGLEQWADAIAAAQIPHWAGPRTPWPARSERPGPDDIVLRSPLRPLAVHAPGTVPLRTAERALAALEAAADWARMHGWPAPLPDEGEGGDGGFDVYLVPGAQAESEARADAPVVWSYLDAVTSFGVVDADVESDALAACVTSAYVQGAMLGQDPAEAAQWRRATGDFLAWLVTGAFGSGAGVAAQQREPWRGWVLDGSDGSGGALWLAMLSARVDHGTGTFVRDVWQLARQRTWEGAELRASPDLWMAIDKALDLAGEKLQDFVEETAVARWFAGDAARASHAAYPALRSLGPDAAVPLLGQTDWAHVPKHLPIAEPAIEPYGSAYGLVDVRGAPSGAQLRLWLDGEYGAQWSFVAVRLAADGHELSRLAAPATRNPRSYLVLELAPGTTDVLLVATSFSERLADADIHDEHSRSLQMIVGR